MTQRIFDVDNPQEIFDLFPDDVIRIEKSDLKDIQDIIIFDNDSWDYTHIKINWRDKTEITRPVDESQWIGKLCWFWDKNEQPFIAVLNEIMLESRYKYTTADGESYKCCRPVRRDEVQFAEDAESKEQDD